MISRKVARKNLSLTDNQQTPAIPAATILLLRDVPEFEVLMIERHADTPFAGGAIVFPGGRIDPGDYDAGWAEYCDGLDDIPAAEHGPRVAAIREAFEETGILFARDYNGSFVPNDRAKALDGWRAQVEDDDALFLQLIKKEGLRLALDALALFARWEPPLRAHEDMRRYHTWFYAACTPPGQEAREDGNEATEVFWTSPQAALDDADQGKRKMIFPTRRNIELLGVSKRADEAISAARRRKAELVQPEIIKRGDESFLVIRDDLGYPVTQEPLATAMRY